MFEVEAIEQGFLAKRARLRAVGSVGEQGKVVVVAAEAASWFDSLRAAVAEGEVITVNLPAFLQLQPGQTVSVAAA